MAKPLRDSLEQENRTASMIAPLPPALLGTPPAELNEDPFWIENKAPSTTERVGTAVGEALGTLSSRVRSGLRVVKGKSREAEDKIEDITDSAEVRARELSGDAEIRVDEFGRTAYRRMRQARVVARRAMYERPIESIVAIGGIGIVLGFVLRIWRSNGD